jgi:hypothetical protein
VDSAFNEGSWDEGDRRNFSVYQFPLSLAQAQSRYESNLKVLVIPIKPSAADGEDAQQQIPRAPLARFGMTIPMGIQSEPPTKTYAVLRPIAVGCFGW